MLVPSAEIDFVGDFRRKNQSFTFTFTWQAPLFRATLLQHTLWGPNTPYLLADEPGFAPAEHQWQEHGRERDLQKHQFHRETCYLRNAFFQGLETECQRCTTLCLEREQLHNWTAWGAFSFAVCRLAAYPGILSSHQASPLVPWTTQGVGPGSRSLPPSTQHRGSCCWHSRAECSLKQSEISFLSQIIGTHQSVGSVIGWMTPSSSRLLSSTLALSIKGRGILCG